MTHTFTPFEDEEECYCSNCVAHTWSFEADEYLYFASHNDRWFDGADSLLHKESTHPERVGRIMLAYHRAYLKTMTGEWYPVH